MKFYVEKDNIGKARAVIRTDFDSKLDKSMVGKFSEVSEKEYEKIKAGVVKKKAPVRKVKKGDAVFTPGEVL